MIPVGFNIYKNLKDRLRIDKHTCKMYEAAGDHKRAVACYKRGIEEDSLAEEFHQRLMLCLKKLGRRAEALSVYKGLKETLTTSLGVEPSAKTSSIYLEVKG